MLKKSNIPSYMQILYNKVYANSFLSSVLDDKRVANILMFGAQKKIIAEIVREIPKNAHVLQIGLTFGDQIEQIYRKVCKQGKFDIFDISETQILAAKEKFGHYNIDIIKHDAAHIWEEKYDIVVCTNLLGDVPSQTKDKIMQNALSCLTNGGKAVFVDCCKPKKWNLFRFPLRWFNLMYRPFADDLWQQPLENFTQVKDEYRWHHTYYCGKIFQKVVAVRKILSSEDVRRLTKMFRGEQ